MGGYWSMVWDHMQKQCTEVQLAAKFKADCERVFNGFSPSHHQWIAQTQIRQSIPPSRLAHTARIAQHQDPHAVGRLALKNPFFFRIAMAVSRRKTCLNHAQPWDWKGVLVRNHRKITMVLLKSQFWRSSPRDFTKSLCFWLFLGEIAQCLLIFFLTKKAGPRVWWPASRTQHQWLDSLHRWRPKPHLAAPGKERIRNMDRLNAGAKQQNMLLVTKFGDFTTGYHRKGWE